MSDCVILTRFWDEYPLETIVAEVEERFTLGPFRAEARPKGDAETEPVLLHFAGDGQRALLAIPPGGSSSVTRGSVAYRVERTRMASRAKRRLRPDLGIVLGLGFAVTVVASVLYGASMCPPELHELSEEITPARVPAIDPVKAVPGRIDVELRAPFGTTPRLSFGASDS
ncbi:MAG: hypothetical protein JW751_13025 [Polyangiaceae bacterium]|nr:hypothetical protein [Polyangiaceae bacterium]